VNEGDAGGLLRPQNNDRRSDQCDAGRLPSRRPRIES
jgi:hypothetical protein